MWSVAEKGLGAEEFDMFGSSSSEEEELGKRRLAGEAPVRAAKSLRAADSLQDRQGYYVAVRGETIGGHYEVLSGTFGQGVFSLVLRCVDLRHDREVAVKCIRHSDYMKATGFEEIDKLKRLRDKDPLGNRPIVRYIDHFDHHGHLCIVCEAFDTNLRAHLKKRGTGKGIDLKTLQMYSHTLVEALLFLKDCGIVHADVKPDNILVKEDRIKLCDLGSAVYEADLAVTENLVPRFYRAPEVYLGYSVFSYAIDMWAAMCTLYEVAAAKTLFAGNTNNEIVLDIIQLAGSAQLPAKMLKAGLYARKYFKSPSKLVLAEGTEVDVGARPQRQIYDLLLANNKHLAHEIARAPSLLPKLKSFVDFLESGLVVDPAKRITPEEALEHPWLTSVTFDND